MANYTTLDQIDVPVLAGRYGIEQPKLTGLTGGAANSSFRVSSPSGEFVLTVLDNHDAHSAQRLAVHTQALFRLGIPTTEVVPARDGSLTVPLGDSTAILKRWVAGEVIEPLPVALLPEAGRALAQLHLLDPASSGLEEVPIGTRRLSPAHLERIPQFEDRAFADWLTTGLRRVRAAESEARRQPRIVHGDLFADNLVVSENSRLTILDWETVSLDDPLLDLGMAAVGLAQENNMLIPTRVRALVDGYCSVIPLTDQDAATLPVEIEHAALIIAFHRYFRHNIRFPDPDKRTAHRALIDFVNSIDGATPV
ncbi:phosphotransferase [Streptomyces sp. MP131-18]|uniref:phosphotransferase n=1 Tax=Streptomyces sp. MP131-18 TaxID=1857892 RepID=UPI00097C231B|nr:phosphotransferase [Streptomyces sp. MP131-18]ONK11304.1 Homoserine kinase [Streptomyces sp. MP131-18]